MKAQCEICNRWSSRSDLQVCELDLTYVTLFPDQYFLGYLLVHTKEHISDLLDMSESLYLRMMGEVRQVIKGIKEAVGCDRVNCQLLGNMVPHIHWHLTPRSNGDPVWPSPYWVSGHAPLDISADRKALLTKELKLAISS